MLATSLRPLQNHRVGLTSDARNDIIIVMAGAKQTWVDTVCHALQRSDFVEDISSDDAAR